MSGFFFGPLGGMLPIEVSAGVDLVADRGRGELVTSGGVRYTQKGRAAPRTWQIGRLWQEPVWARMLSYAASGVIAECYLYDVAVARQNLLRATDCVGAGDPVLVDGVPMGALATGTGPRAYLLPGRTVSISCWTTATAGATVLTASHNGKSIEVTAPPGTGARYAYSTYTPMADGAITTQFLGTLSGLRIHEGAPDRHFLTTQGTPCMVDVHDPGQSLQMVAQDTTRIDYTVTLAEVGQPTF